MGGTLAGVRVDDDALETYELVRTIADEEARADWVRRTLDAEAARVLRRHVKEHGREGRAAELLAATMRRLRS